MKGEWVTVPRRYGMPGDSYMIGQVKVAEAGWNDLRSRSDGPNNQYVFHVLLPGLKVDSGFGATIEEVKYLAELRVEVWFKALKSKRGQ